MLWCFTLVFFFKQKTAYEMRISDWSSDVCSSDLLPTYPEIKVAIGVYEPVQERFKAFEPEAIHIATEGPIGLAARRICVEWKLPFTTSYHTRLDRKSVV